MGTTNFDAVAAPSGFTGPVNGAVTGATTGAHNGTVGATTPSTGAFTTVTATTVTAATVGTHNGSVGATTPSTGVFTTLSASTSAAVGAAGTAITQIAVYSQTVTPASVAAATVAEQTFTVTGLTTADKVLVNHAAFGNATGIAGVRVSAANTLAVSFVNPTAGALVPAAGTWSIVAIRS